MKKKFTALLLSLSLVVTLSPFMAVYADEGEGGGAGSGIAQAYVPTTDAAVLLDKAGLTISGNTTDSWNYGGTGNDGTGEPALRITGENVVISGTAKQDMMIAINPNVSKVTIKDLNHGGHNILLMNNDENWSGTEATDDLTGTNHTIELLGASSIGGIEFYDFTKIPDLDCNIEGNQSITFTGGGVLNCDYIFSDYRITFDLKAGGKIDANNKTGSDNMGEGYAVHCADKKQGIFLKTNNVITTPNKGIIYSSNDPEYVYIADADGNAAIHGVIQYQEIDNSTQTGDSGISILVLILALASIGAAVAVLIVKKRKA